MSPMIQKTIRFDPEGFAALEQAAQQNGVSISEAVRILIRRDIKVWDTEGPRRALDDCFGDFVRAFVDASPDTDGIGPLADFLVGDVVAGYMAQPDLHTYAAIQDAIPEDDAALWDALPTAWNLYVSVAV